MTETEPKPDTGLKQNDSSDGSHYTPDKFCPFCNQNVKKHAKGCIGKRFSYTNKDRSENFERLRKLYKNR